LELVHDRLCKSILAGLRFAAQMDYSSLGTKEDTASFTAIKSMATVMVAFNYFVV